MDTTNFKKPEDIKREILNLLRGAPSELINEIETLGIGPEFLKRLHSFGLPPSLVTTITELHTMYCVLKLLDDAKNDVAVLTQQNKEARQEIQDKIVALRFLRAKTNELGLALEFIEDQKLSEEWEDYKERAEFASLIEEIENLANKDDIWQFIIDNNLNTAHNKNR